LIFFYLTKSSLTSTRQVNAINGQSRGSLRVVTSKRIRHAKMAGAFERLAGDRSVLGGRPDVVYPAGDMPVTKVSVKA